MNTLPPMIVLAAGRSTRMGSPKALLTVHGRALLEHHICACMESGCETAVVVLGHQADHLLSRLNLRQARVVINRDFDRGQFSSVRTGLREVLHVPAHAAGQATAAFVTPVDCPPLPRVLLESLYRRVSAPDRPAAAVPLAGGRPGHPVLLGREAMLGVIHAADDASLAGVLSALGSRVATVETGLDAIRWNINTPEDLRRYLEGGAPEPGGPTRDAPPDT